MLTLVKGVVLAVLAFVAFVMVLAILLAVGLTLLSWIVSPFSMTRAERIGARASHYAAAARGSFGAVFKIVVAGVVIYLFVAFFLGD